MTVSLFHYPLKEITLEQIQELISPDTEETKQLDYKKELPKSRQEQAEENKAQTGKNSKDPNFEFACDISAMANSGGGDIIYGIEEDEETGRPKGIAPVTIINWDETRQRLQNLVFSNIGPTIIGLDMRAIRLKPNADKYIVIIRVPHSYTGPHQVVMGRKKFWARHPGGKHPMDFQELKAAFLSSGEVITQVRKWRDERLVTFANQLPLKLDNGPIQILHLTPLNFSDPSANISVENLGAQDRFLRPLASSPEKGARYNLEGYVTYRVRESKPPCLNGYVQFFRTGQIESVRILQSNPEPCFIFGQHIEEHILVAVEAFLQAMQNAGVAVPIVISVSFKNIINYSIRASDPSPFGTPMPQQIERNDFITPEIMVYEYPLQENIPELMKSLIDAIWNASGYATSPFYVNGVRKQPRLSR